MCVIYGMFCIESHQQSLCILKIQLNVEIIITKIVTILFGLKKDLMNKEKVA